MSDSTIPTRGRGRGGARGGISRGGFIPRSNFQREIIDDSEADETRILRSQFKTQLKTAKELFASWADEDLLLVLQESNGDVELAIERISEGHAQQWGAVKAKKTKKEIPVVTVPVTTPFAGRGGFGDRGRGRGSFEGGRGAPRGGRGGIRGGRGGFTAPVRTPYANGETNGATPESFTPAAPALVAPTWGGKPVAAPAGEPELETATPSSEWGAATEVSTTATTGWGEDAPDTNGEEDSTAPAASGWVEPVAPKARVVSKIIAPGSKMSWAQVTRPITPPKPSPPPPAVIVAPTPAPLPIVIAEVVEQVEVVIPEIESEPVASSWAEEPTAPGPLDAWGTPSPAPLGVGAGWADAVGAAQEPTYQHPQAVAEVEAHLPPNDINAAGPIEISAPVVEESIAQQVEEQFGAGPPGLAKRTINRPQDAVVMANERAPVERVGVQFGSLSMFDGQPAFGQEAAIQEAAAPQDQSYGQQYQSHEQQHQAQQQHQQHQQQEQGVQTSFSQQPQQNLFPQQGSAFQDRYNAPSPYQQPQQQQNESAYAPFKTETNSPYFQPQHSQSPAPGQIPQAAYAPFNSAPPASAQPDYSAYGQQDPLRNMGFYDPYQNASPLARSDDPSKAATPAPITPQAQQQQQQGQYPGMMPYYPPYGGYYQGYPQQGYQQPNYGQYAQQYQQIPQQYSNRPSPQFSQQGQYQQQPPLPQAQTQSQPGALGSGNGGFRGGLPPQQQGYATQQGQYVSQQGHGGFGGYEQRNGGGERKEGFSSSKDLDRAFF